MEWSLLESLIVSQLVKNFPAFYEVRRPITLSDPCPEPDESSPYPHTLLLINFNIVQSNPRRGYCFLY
jgi:hypothetical protein